MKKRLILSWTLLLCVVALAGCRITTYSAPLFKADEIAKAQEIRVTDSATGDAITSLTEKEELEDFIEAMDVERWRIADLPADLTRETAFTLYQAETVTVLFGDNTHEVNEICTFHSYRDAAYITIEIPLVQFDINFSIPGKAADYLHSFVR